MDEMDSQRLLRLEEALLFSDRRLDELHDQVLALLGRVEALTARIAGAELTMGQIATHASQPPPEVETDLDPEATSF